MTSPEGDMTARLTQVSRRQLIVGALGLVALGAAATVVPTILAQRGAGAPSPDAHVTRAADVTASEEAGSSPGGAPPAGEQSQQRLLLVTTAEDGGPATSVTLLAGSAGDVRPSVLHLPTGTLVRAPGMGEEQLRTIHDRGGAALLSGAVSETLSLDIDEVAVVTEPAFADFLDRAGGVELDVAERLVTRDAEGGAEVLVDVGPQTLDGAALVDLWTHRSHIDEVGAFRRRQQVLEAVFTAAADDRVRDRLVADGAPQLRMDAEAAWLRELFADMADAETSTAVRHDLLPVERTGSAGTDGRRSYRVDLTAAGDLVRSMFGAADDIDVDGGARVQVLNGVGVPGVADLVEQRLGEDVEILYTGNATSFDFSETRVLVYEESGIVMEQARRMQDKLGVGTIQVSRQPQSIVDFTIVVGEDLVSGAVSGHAP